MRVLCLSELTKALPLLFPLNKRLIKIEEIKYIMTILEIAGTVPITKKGGIPNDQRINTNC
jgi:hypothetical protein